MIEIVSTMLKEKYFSISLVVVILVVAIITVTLRNQSDNLPVGSTISETEVVQVQPEPITIRQVSMDDPEEDQIPSKLFIGKEKLLVYEIINVNSTSYIVEIHPDFSETTAAPWLGYRFEDLEGSEIDPTGTAMHLMVAPNSVTQIDFILGSKEDAPSWELYSFMMYLSPTNCDTLEGCLWG